MKNATKAILAALGTVALFVAALVVSREATQFFADLGWYQASAEAQSSRLREVVLFDNYDLNSTSFVYCDSGGPPTGVACSTGSAAGDGWITVQSEADKAVMVEIIALTVTGGIDFVIEGRLRNSGALGTGFQVWPSPDGTYRNETAAGSFGVQVPDSLYQLRVGMKIGTSDTAGTEDIEVVFNSFGGDLR